jgi:hypothetical protein
LKTEWKEWERRGILVFGHVSGYYDKLHYVWDRNIFARDGNYNILALKEKIKSDCIGISEYVSNEQIAGIRSCNMMYFRCQYYLLKYFSYPAWNHEARSLT